uniref:Growth/differentiation factor 3-like n=1 Tax=Salmo trutta TaxID=8032 RepID=A0A674EE39_SALTR
FLRPHGLCFLFSRVVLLFSLCQGEGRPRLTQEGTPHLGQEENQRALVLEAVKTGILSSMGMEREARPREMASEEELMRMHRLYRETLRQLRRSSSQEGETQHSPRRASTVLHPAIVEPLKVLWRDEEHPSDVLWYRAVFHKNPNIRKELTLARAELKLYRQLLDGSKAAEPTIRDEVHVKIYETKPLNSSLLIHPESLVQTVAARTGDLTLDIRTVVGKWSGRSNGHSLVVEVELALEEGTDPKRTPQMVLEVDLVEPRSAGRRRRTRSNKEDNCDEDGRCCRKSINVSFKEIGWSDWVVAPAGYNMHFCDGSCPHNYKPASMHAQAKSRLHHINKGATPHPCCVPAAYEPVILMHYDSWGKLKLTPYNDLIVSKCHCA